METSDVSFARTDGNHVAWRELIGDPRGEHSLVMVNGGFFPMDSLLEDAVSVRLVEGLAALGRLVMFDRRGIGVSDPIGDWLVPPTEQWTDDLAAVIDASGYDRPAVFSWVNQAVARRYAVREPDRVSKLILFNPDSPVDERDEGWLERYREGLRRLHEEGDTELMRRVWPNRWSDPEFRSWLGQAGRTGASPAEAARYRDWHFREKHEYTLDNREVTSPALVIVRGEGIWPTTYLARAAELLPDAELVVLPPGDAMAIGAGVDDLLAEISRYLTGGVRLPPPQRHLSAILMTDIVASTERASSDGDEAWKRLLDRHDQTYRRFVDRAGGEVVKSTGDGILAVLPSATMAIDVAAQVRDLLRSDGLEVRHGIHVGEVDRRGDDVSGISLHVAARVMSMADAGQILLTDMARRAAVGREFGSWGTTEIRGVDGDWELFEPTGDDVGR